MDCATSAELALATGHVVLCVQPAAAPWWTYLPLFATPFIAAIAARIAFVFARRNIETARLIAREKATIDLIEKRESTDLYRTIHQTFRKHRIARSFGLLNDPKYPDDERTRRDVVAYLNHYELVSIGILAKTLDATIYRTWMEGPFVRDWIAARDWIQRERWDKPEGGQWHYRKTVLANYQTIACQWSPDAKPLDETSGGPPDEAGGPGDEPLPEPIDDVVLGS